MLSVSAAQSLILDAVAAGPTETCHLPAALGRTLRETIVSPTDSPPFDKSLMDGYAVLSSDLPEGTAALRVLEKVTAGVTPTQTVITGTATQVMTGAPLPTGADAVVRVEDSRFDESTAAVTLDTKPPRPGTNILRQGESLQAGEALFEPGISLRAQEIALLAEIGHVSLTVTACPRVAILSTGDELVPPEFQPGPSQIRNSNAPMLAALVSGAGGVPLDLGIAIDRREELTALIRAGLDSDFLILSGGVSAGELDLVPGILAECGVEPRFHKLLMKPGKPVWFGVLARESGRMTYVFGLPGNPVSSLVCFKLLAEPALRRYLGRNVCLPSPILARLQQPHVARGDRPTYHPARLEWVAGHPTVTPVRWRGSADLLGTARSNCLVLFPAGDRDYQPGDELETFGE